VPGKQRNDSFRTAVGWRAAEQSATQYAVSRILELQHLEIARKWRRIFDKIALTNVEAQEKVRFSRNGAFEKGSRSNADGRADTQ
jgi:hypothetical protein